ncbi:hypothetical protein DFJ74DRAFT_654551 [Hyaloraphidium curvatum]|nr:hypothetical protein DFJ74DRAFT_654551 [Hyaloraphidium curvatum]
MPGAVVVAALGVALSVLWLSNAAAGVSVPPLPVPPQSANQTVWTPTAANEYCQPWYFDLPANKSVGLSAVERDRKT